MVRHLFPGFEDEDMTSLEYRFWVDQSPNARLKALQLQRQDLRTHGQSDVLPMAQV
jgi:hypothetical protein